MTQFLFHLNVLPKEERVLLPVAAILLSCVIDACTTSSTFPVSSSFYLALQNFHFTYVPCMIAAPLASQCYLTLRIE